MIRASSCHKLIWPLFVLLVAAVAPVSAKGPGRTAAQPVPKLAVGPTFDWSDLDTLLARHVVQGRVDYAAWKARDAAALESVLSRAGAWALYDSATSREKLVFLINAYNAFVIRDIVAVWPIATVKDVKGFFDTTKHRIAGDDRTLDEIEKKLIRPLSGGDPSYHFALVCGAMGCPELRPHAYRAETWPTDSANQIQKFVADPAKLRIDEEPYVMHASQLFDWYRNEFEVGDTTIPRWVGPNLSLGMAMKLAQSEPPIEFLPYDWSVNAAPGGGR